MSVLAGGEHKCTTWRPALALFHFTVTAILRPQQVKSNSRDKEQQKQSCNLSWWQRPQLSLKSSAETPDKRKWGGDVVSVKLAGLSDWETLPPQGAARGWAGPISTLFTMMMHTPENTFGTRPPAAKTPPRPPRWHSPGAFPACLARRLRCE